MNKIERMQTVFKGGTPDITPAGFWFHYPGTNTVQEMVDAHLSLYNETDMDVIKIMQDYPYPALPAVNTPADWYKVKMAGKNSPEFDKLAEVLKRLADATNGEVMLFQTMFGPFKAAVMQYGDALVMEHAKADPTAVAAGVKAIAESLQEWAEGFLTNGAHGIYFSAQFGDVGRFSQEAWAQMVRPADVAVLGVADGMTDRYNMLHICAEPDYDFKAHVDWFANYPGDIINWSVKDTGYTLAQGRKMFDRPILGGMNNKGNLVTGSDEAIRAEAAAVIEGFGRAGFMLGADCTVQGKEISQARIRTAVETAHSFCSK